MSATVNVICYKSKVLKNNEHPLMIRVCKDRKMKYISISLSMKPEHWDFDKNKPKPNCPDKDYILQIITERTKEYQEQILEFKAINKEFTVVTLVDKVNNSVKNKTVEDVFRMYIEMLRNSNRLRYAHMYKTTLNSLLLYNTHLDIYFPEIDTAWLKKHEGWLFNNNLASNTVGTRLRHIRTIFNYAIEQKIVRADYYPFKTYKVSKLHKETVKRAISKEDIQRIIEYKSTNRYIRFPIDLFAFTYYMGGINFTDIARLTKDNIVDDRLIYTRKKTKKLIKLPLHPVAKQLIDKYSQEGNLYLFPILSSFHKTELQKENRIHKIIAKVNKRLKEVGVALNIPIKLTLYVGRHSHATILKKAGVSTAIISESLGHTQERTTLIYLDSFGNEQMTEAMSHL